MFEFVEPVTSQVKTIEWPRDLVILSSDGFNLISYEPEMNTQKFKR